jgi:hypothetical protein
VSSTPIVVCQAVPYGLATAAAVNQRGLRALLRVLTDERLFTLGPDDTVTLGELGTVRNGTPADPPLWTGAAEAGLRIVGRSEIPGDHAAARPGMRPPKARRPTPVPHVMGCARLPTTGLGKRRS